MPRSKPAAMNAERRLTLSEAADLTGVSLKALRGRADRGALTVSVEHGRRVVTVGELERVGLLEPGAVPGRAGEIVTRLEILVDELRNLIAELRLELRD